MDDGRPLHERVAALERAVTDGHADDGLPDAASLAARVDDIEATVEEQDDRLAELEAAVQALRGFAGGVRSIDDEIELRANTAIARVDRLEAELTRAETATPTDAEIDRDRFGGDEGAEAGDQRDGTAVDAAAPETTTERLGDPHTDGARNCEGTLRETVTGRSDAALAEAAARSDRSDREPDAERSLADRLRNLL